MTGKQLKNSILQWAIQGKLVPQDPNDEPASVLLEKIRAEKARLIKEGKIKKDKKESIIYRGEDNSYYEKFADGKVVCIDDEIPFEIPNGWEWCRFSDVLRIVGNLVSPTEYQHYKHIAPDNIEKGTGILLECHTVAEDKVRSNNHLVNKGQIVYSKIRPLLRKVIIAPFDALCSADMYPIETLLNKCFCKYLMLSDMFNIQIAAICSSRVKMPKANIEELSNIIIPIPPLAEQHRIAAKIEEVFTVADKYGKAQQQKDVLNKNISLSLRKSILQEAIQGRLVPQNPADEPASVLLERIQKEINRLLTEGKLKKKNVVNSVIFRDDNKYFEKKGKETVCIDEEIPFEIPDTWAWVRLSDVVQVNPKNDVPDNTLAAFIPMERIDATYLSSFTYSERKWGDIKSGFTHFADGDVAFAKITPCFQNRKSMILKELPNGVGAGTTELKVLRPYAETIDRDYLLFFLESSYFVEEATFKGTANQQRIISGYMENKLFPLPPLHEQRRISKMIKESYKLIGL